MRLSPQEAAEADTLSAILYDNDLLPQLRDGLGGTSPMLHWDYFQTPALQRVAKAAWELDSAGRPVTVASLLSVLGDDPATHRAVQRLDDRAIEATARSLPVLVERIAGAHNRRVLDQLLTAARAHLDEHPNDTRDLATKLMGDLAGLTMERGRRRDGSLRAIIQSGRHREIALGSPLGIAWLDDPGDPRSGRPGMIGGLAPGEKLVITGLYGGRKTSTGVFMTLQSARSGRTRFNPLKDELEAVPPERVLYIQLDDNRETWTNWAIAQMASARLRKLGVTGRERAIGASGLHESYRTPAQHDAIRWAEQRLGGMPIIVRDGADGVHRWDELLPMMREAVLVDGVTLIVIDYIQAVEVKGITEIYKRMEYLTQQLTAFFTMYGSTHGVKLIVMSQRPENVNAFGATGDSAGLKGGGDLAALASYILQTRSESKEPWRYFIKVLKARFARRGIELEYTVLPENGLILDPDKIPAVTQESPEEQIAYLM